MAILTLLCVGVYTLVSAVAGVRLLMRWRGSHGVPELLIGLAYVTAPATGYPLVVMARAMPNRETTLAAIAVGQTLVMFGCCCFLFFNAKVFRPSSGWATFAAAIGSALLATSGWIGVSSAFRYTDPAVLAEHARVGTTITLVVLGCGYAWTAFEGFRYYAMMRKRMALGLADPVTTNRFLLWGFSGVSASVWNSIAGIYLAMGQNIVAHPVPVLATSLGGLFCAVMLILVFMPPAWYTRWLTRSAGAGALATAS